jgi:MFS family permease
MAQSGGAGLRRLFSGSFGILWTFYFFVFVAGYQLMPVVPLHLRAMGASVGESGSFMTAFSMGSALGALFTGELGDRMGLRRVLKRGALLVAFFLAIYATFPSRWTFLLLAPFHGVAWSALRTCSQAAAGGLLPSESKTEGLAWFGLASPLGVSLGPAIGLALYPLIGFRPLLTVLTLAFIGLFFLIQRLPTDPPRHPELLRWPRPPRAIFGLAFLMFLLALSYGPMPPYAAQEAQTLGMRWSSALLTGFALGMVGLRIVVGFTGLGSRPIARLPWMFALAMLGSLILTFAPGALSRHLGGAMIYGAGYGMVHTLVMLESFHRVREDQRGAASGLIYFAFDLGAAIGARGVGQVMELRGFRWGWGIGFLLLGLASLASLQVIRAKSGSAEKAHP